MKYIIVQLNSGTHAVSTFDDAVDDVISKVEALGFKHNGFVQPDRGLNQTLHGKPKFQGLIGPMVNGSDLRYEDSAAYNLYSS